MGLVVRELTSKISRNSHLSYRELLCACGPLGGYQIAAPDVTGRGVFPASGEIININNNYVPNYLYVR